MNFLFGQSENAYKYANALLFHAWEMRPDSLIAKFVEKFIPNMASSPKKLTAISNLGDMEFVPQIPTMHGIEFVKHPNFNGTYVNGEIQYLTLESDNAVNGIRDVYLILNYSRKKDGEKDLIDLQSKFDAPFFKKSVDSNSSVINIRYSPLEEKKYPDTDIQIIFYQDPINPKFYKILFRFRHKEQD